MMLPIGLSDFKRLRQDGYVYVDKSLAVDDVLSEGGLVKLITRPRRFGKTLNLSMLRYFFESDPETRKDLFQGLAIAKTHHMDRPADPVIYLTLKDLKAKTFEVFMAAFAQEMARLYRRHSELVSHLDPTDHKIFQRILSQEADAVTLKRSLFLLTQWLHEVHGRSVMVFIDEYDSSYHGAKRNQYEDDVFYFMRVFLGAALKDNLHLELAVLVGNSLPDNQIIFFEIENIKFFTVLDKGFADKFGFSDAEVAELLRSAKTSYERNQIRTWSHDMMAGVDGCIGVH